MKQVRLIDVANEAGVSKSTASQYLNGRYEYMSESTKEKLRLAVDKLNFVPNPIARSLKTQKTYTIGIIIQNIIGSITSQTIRGIDDYLKSKGYNVLIYNSDYIEATEKKSIANLKSLRADGLIISSSGNISTLLNEEDQSGLPVVHIHRDFENLNVSSVLSDYLRGSLEATNYLLKLGHKRIALISREYENIPSRMNRVQGYKDALSEANLKEDPGLIRICEDENDIGDIYETLMALEEPPTAIFTLFTKITMDLLSYFNDQKISVPNQISHICFDDLPMAHLLKTPLTAVNQQAYKLGQESAKSLLERIANKDDLQVTHKVLPCELIIRESCGPLF